MFRFIIVCIGCLLFCTPLLAQQWSDAELKQANTAADASYLNEEEKGIILYMNLLRINGPKFYQTYLQDYINSHNTRVRQYRNYNQLRIAPNNAYLLSLERDLKNVKNFPLFYPSEKLSILSRNHAIDLRKNNLNTHESSNGETFSTRLSRYFPNNAMAENIDFGYYKSLDIVCHLLLDAGVPSLGHRRNILDTKYKLNLVGVNIQTHPTYTYCAVIDFVADPSLYVRDK